TADILALDRAALNVRRSDCDGAFLRTQYWKIRRRDDDRRKYTRCDPHTLHQYLRSGAGLELLCSQQHCLGAGRNRFCAVVVGVFVQPKTVESMAATLRSTNLAVNERSSAALQVEVRLARATQTDKF